jgi:threonine dehydratase
VAREEAARRASNGEGEFVPSFHEDLIRGVATYGHELMTSVTDRDVIYCAIGMGSGIASLVAVRDLLGLPTQIVGVVSAHADAMAQTIAGNALISTETAKTFADGVATRVPNPDTVSIIRRGVEQIVTVTDDEVASAIRRLYRCTHNVAEGAGAAAYQERERMLGKRIAVILTGGNIDRAWFVQVLGGETPSVVT